LFGLFAGAVVIVGGWQGVRSLIALALTLAVVVRVVVPLILAGWDPAWVAIVIATGVTAVTFVITEGLRRSTIAAGFGTALSLILVAVLASVFDALARFSPLRGSEDTAYLISLGGTSIDLGRTTVAGRAMNVGRSHISATVNTLVLAYVGASLPLIILFVAGGQDPLLIGSQEIVAVEIVRALTGSIGIVAAVPITTAVAAALIGRRIPLLRDERVVRRASGWDT
jgi:uncharacterized membrane protein